MTSNLSEIGIYHGGTTEASPISYFTCLGGLRISGDLDRGSGSISGRHQSCPGLSQCGAKKLRCFGEGVQSTMN